MKKTKKRNQGQAIAEYLILTAIIAIGSIAIVQVVGRNLKFGLTKISDALQGKSSTDRQGVDATERHFKTRDLGDFSDGIQDNDQ